MAADELVEEIDEDGAVLRVVTRAEMRAGRLRHRCVFLLVVHGGRLLVHRRADDKDVWPGRWDVAAGGVVTAGERWDDAARRELAEELGIDAEPVLVGKGAWEGDEAKVVGRVYLVEHPGPFLFDDGEVVEARFVDRRELVALLAAEATCPDSIAVALPYVLARLI
ncbi:MAG: hydrolase [Actinomycetia bacterium]|nr:hydrolase [Actinomycetes bacterium]